MDTTKVTPDEFGPAGEGLNKLGESFEKVSQLAGSAQESLIALQGEKSLSDFEVSSTRSLNQFKNAMKLDGSDEVGGYLKEYDNKADAFVNSFSDKGLAVQKYIQEHVMPIRASV